MNKITVKAGKSRKTNFVSNYERNFCLSNEHPHKPSPVAVRFPHPHLITRRGHYLVREVEFALEHVEHVDGQAGPPGLPRRLVDHHFEVIRRALLCSCSVFPTRGR